LQAFWRLQFDPVGPEQLRDLVGIEMVLQPTELATDLGDAFGRSGHSLFFAERLQHGRDPFARAGAAESQRPLAQDPGIVLVEQPM
jgi:hypothetical protein